MQFLAPEVSKGSAQLTPKNCLRCLVCKDYLRSCFPDSRDPAPWEDDEAFREAQKELKGLAVVNDRAGCGVALIQDLNKKVTKDEVQLPFLLWVVSEHQQQCLLSDGQTLLEFWHGK